MQQMEPPKLPPATKGQEKHPLRERLFKKSGNYIDGIIINLLSAIVLGGGLYLAQKVWGLRLIPFNVLDAIIIGSLCGIGVLLLIVVIFGLVFYRYFKKHPELLTGIGAMLFLGGPAARMKDKSFKWESPPKENPKPPQGSSPAS